MILTNRLFQRQAPTRETKNIYIFCEGAKRELQYFSYFKEMDSRINIEIYNLHPHEDNSPLGLLEIAKRCVISDTNNPHPKYSSQKNDEVWMVLDVDMDKMQTRQPQIREVTHFCKNQAEWHIVQSNPCFEVWLYFHIFKSVVKFEGDGKCSNWKSLVNKSLKGGFDSRKHPIYIQTAIKNAKNTYSESGAEPKKGCSEVYRLGDNMMTILKEKIARVLRNMEM